MTLIRRSLFNQDDNESVSAPLRTFLRSSDDQQVNTGLPTYNVERRSSRRSTYSFRGQPSFNDAPRNDVGTISYLDIVTVESRDGSNRNGQKNLSPNDGSLGGRVWSRDNSYVRELNVEKRQGIHTNSRASSPTRFHKEVDDEERTIRINNYGRNKSSSTQAWNEESWKSKAVDLDSEPFSIPALKCGPKLEMMRSLNRTPKGRGKENVAPATISREIISVPVVIPHNNIQHESNEAHLSVEVELLHEKKKKGFSQLKSILNTELMKNRSMSRGRSREVRDNGGETILPQRLFSRSQSIKASNRSDKKDSSEADNSTNVDETLSPSHLKRLATKLASLRQGGKSCPRSNSADEKNVEMSKSPKTVVDAPQVSHEENLGVVFYEKPQGNKFCGIGMCFTELGEFFVGDTFGEENQYPEAESVFSSETHI